MTAYIHKYYEWVKSW